MNSSREQSVTPIQEIEIVYDNAEALLNQVRKPRPTLFQPILKVETQGSYAPPSSFRTLNSQRLVELDSLTQQITPLFNLECYIQQNQQLIGLSEQIYIKYFRVQKVWDLSVVICLIISIFLLPFQFIYHKNQELYILLFVLFIHVGDTLVWYLSYQTIIVSKGVQIAIMLINIQAHIRFIPAMLILPNLIQEECSVILILLITLYQLIRVIQIIQSFQIRAILQCVGLQKYYNIIEILSLLAVCITCLHVLTCLTCFILLQHNHNELKCDYQQYTCSFYLNIAFLMGNYSGELESLESSIYVTIIIPLWQLFIVLAIATILNLLQNIQIIDPNLELLFSQIVISEISLFQQYHYICKYSQIKNNKQQLDKFMKIIEYQYKSIILYRLQLLNQIVMGNSDNLSMLINIVNVVEGKIDQIFTELGFYLVLEGEIQVKYYNYPHIEQNVQICLLKAGDTFGEIELCTNQNQHLFLQCQLVSQFVSTFRTVQKEQYCALKDTILFSQNKPKLIKCYLCKQNHMFKDCKHIRIEASIIIVNHQQIRKSAERPTGRRTTLYQVSSIRAGYQQLMLLKPSIQLSDRMFSEVESNSELNSSLNEQPQCSVIHPMVKNTQTEMLTSFLNIELPNFASQKTMTNPNARTYKFQEFKANQQLDEMKQYQYYYPNYNIDVIIRSLNRRLPSIMMRL